MSERRLDTASSASRQHYIDTGEYLKEGEADRVEVLAPLPDCDHGAGCRCNDDRSEDLTLTGAELVAEHTGRYPRGSAEWLTEGMTEKAAASMVEDLRRADSPNIAASVERLIASGHFLPSGRPIPDHAFEVRATALTANGRDLDAWERKSPEQRAKAGCAVCGLSEREHGARPITVDGFPYTTTAPERDEEPEPDQEHEAFCEHHDGSDADLDELDAGPDAWTR